MTQDEALSCLTELRALERLHAAVSALPARGFEWRCGLTALDDRIRWVRYCLSREDQALLDTIEELYAYKRRLELLEPVPISTGMPVKESSGMPEEISVRMHTKNRAAPVIH